MFRLCFVCFHLFSLVFRKCSVGFSYVSVCVSWVFRWCFFCFRLFSLGVSWALRGGFVGFRWRFDSFR